MPLNTLLQWHFLLAQVLSNGTGELDAIDANTGKMLWASPLKAP